MRQTLSWGFRVIANAKIFKLIQFILKCNDFNRL